MSFLETILGLGEVLLKLLPFTHSELGHISFFTGMDISDIVITTIISLLLFFSIRWGMALYRSFREDEKDIDFLVDTLRLYDGKLQKNYVEFGEKLKSNKRIWLLWNEFDESIIKSKNHFTEEIEYRNSIDSEYFFNKKNLLTHIGSKWYSTVPSLLLGIGLIGTFLGLFVGLIHFDITGEANALKKSMQILIHAAGVKFASSIWGLVLSLLFTYFDKKLENKLHDKIDEIQQKIDYSFERKTAEQSLNAIYENGTEQRDALNDLRSTLNTTIIESQAKSDSIMSEKFDRLVNVLENFASKTSDSNSSALEQTIASFMDGIKQAGAEQGNALADVLSKSTEKLGELVQVIENTAHLQEERNQQLRKDIEDIKTSQQEMLDKVGEALTRGAKEASESLTQAGLALANSQNGVLDKLSSTSEMLAQSPKELERIFGELKTNASAIEQSINNMTESLKNAPTHIQLFSNSAQKLEQFGDKIQTVGSGFSKFNDSIENYRQTVDSATSSLKDSASQAQNTNKYSLETYQNISNQYSTLLDKNKQSIEEFSKSVKMYLDDYHRNTQDGVQKTFSSFNGELSKFASTMTEAIRELDDAIEQLSAKVSR